MSLRIFQDFSYRVLSCFLLVQVLGACKMSEIAFRDPVVSGQEAPDGWQAPNQAPVANVESSAYRSPLTIVLSIPDQINPEAQLSIRYVLEANDTLDCSSGTLYSEPLIVDSLSVHLRAIVCDQYKLFSPELSRSYTFDNVGPSSTVNFSVLSTTYSQSFSLTLSHPEARGQIRYKLNALIASCSDGQAYTVPIVISNGSAVVEAIACDELGNQSTTRREVYTYQPTLVQPSAPTISPISRAFKTSFSATLTSAVGTTIRYSQNGSAPANCASGSAYQSPITVSGATTTLSAIACNAQQVASVPAQATYTFDNMVPAISVTAPQANAVVNANFDLRGTCESGLTVNVQTPVGAALTSNCSSGNFLAVIPIDRLIAGANTLNISQVDSVGNEGRVQHALTKQATRYLATNILKTNCLSCHGSANLGNINYIDNEALLISNGKIKPGQAAENSLLFTRMNASGAGMMPPSGKLSSADLTTIRVWIESMPPGPGAAPAAPVISPASQAFKNPIQVTLTVQSGNSIRFNKTATAPADCSSGSVYSAPISVSGATTTISAIACNSAGVKSTSAASGTYTYDNSGPSLAISAPAAGATVSSNFDLRGSCEGNTSVSVVTPKPVTRSANCTSSMFSIAVSLADLNDGANSLSITQQDALGNSSTIQHSLLKAAATSVAAPTISPESKTFKNAFSVTMSGSSGTSIRYNKSSTAPADCSSGTQYSSAISVATLNTTISAIACNSANLKSAPTQVVYTFDNVSPVIAVNSPLANSTLNADFDLRGTCESGLTVSVTTPKPVTKTGPCTSGAFAISFLLTDLNSGSNTLTLSQTDGVGNFGQINHTISRQVVNLSAMEILQAKCMSCHGANSAGSGNHFNYVTDVDKLIANGKIRPGIQAEISPLMARILSPVSPMPPAGPRLTDQEIAAIKSWIEGMQRKPFEYELSQNSICADSANNIKTDRRVWLLTPQQIQNSLEDILGINFDVTTNFNTVEAFGFTNNADQNKYNSGFENGLNKAAELLGLFVIANKNQLLSACAGNTANRVCVRDFVNAKAFHFFRRVVSSAEIDQLMVVYDAGTGAKNTDFGFAGIVQALFISPSFLYRTEVGASPTATGSIRLTNFEIMSALAFTLTNSTPSAQQLFTAADSTQLNTSQKIRDMSQSILNTDKAKKGVRAFFNDLLQLKSLPLTTKDASRFPTFNSSLKNDMKEETLRFVEEATLSANYGNLLSLLNGNFTFANKRLGTHYGISGSSSDSTFVKVTGTASRPMSGLLSQGSLLAIHSTSQEASPIKRGKFIRERILCYTLPSPPSGVPELPPIDPNASLRDRYRAHSSVPQCMGCHALIDPIGFGFLRYDPVGRYGGNEDDSGSVVDGGDASVDPFYGVLGLSTKLGSSKMAGSCLATNFFVYSMGRPNIKGDRCEIAKINGNFFSQNMSLKEMILSTVSSDGFIYRK